MIKRLRPYLPGLVLNVLAGILYGRAGYGPFSNPAQRAKPYEATRGFYPALFVHALGLMLLVVAHRRVRQSVRPIVPG